MDPEKDVLSTHAALAWEIKKRCRVLRHDFKQIRSEQEAMMFCFTWGVPPEVFTWFGKGLLDATWSQLNACLKSITKNCFWESPIEMYQRLIKTVEGWHFSPFIKDSSGIFEPLLIENDPIHRPLLVIKLNPAFKWAKEDKKGYANSHIKDLWRRMSDVVPIKKIGSMSSRWCPSKAGDVVKNFRFVLDDYSNNHYKLSKQKIEAVFKDVLKECRVFPETPKTSHKRSERLYSMMDAIDDISLDGKILDKNLVTCRLKEQHSVFKFEKGTFYRDLEKIESLANRFKKIAMRKELLFTLEPTMYS